MEGFSPIGWVGMEVYDDTDESHARLRLVSEATTPVNVNPPTWRRRRSVSASPSLSIGLLAPDERLGFNPDR
jgi:hypothetical protein